jgi:predicted DCC family thiol-disulfide oxidoreductase YuxK
MSAAERPSTVVFYDGICGLCNGFVAFLLARDTRQRLRFAALQTPIARQILEPHGIDLSALNTIYVVAGWQTPSERVLARSAAVLHAVRQLGGFWSLAAGLASVVPRPIANVAYDAIAHIRYRLFGKYDRCPIPPPGWQRSFLDQ